MNKLLRLTASLLVALIVLIGIIRFAEQTLVRSQKIVSFTQADCNLPCVFGITPGITTWAEYKDLMTANMTSPQALNRGHNFSVEDGNGTKLELLADYYANNNPQKTISYLSASAPNGKITSLGTVLAVQHTPVRVLRLRPFSSDGMLLFFVFGDDQRVVVSAWVDHTLSPDTPVKFLAVFDNSDTTDRELLASLDVEEIGWLGFGSIQKYMNATPLKFSP